MAAFQLAQLDLTLLDRVITKLDVKSYFRIQQTCHYLEERVQHSRNAAVQLDGHIVLRPIACRLYPSKESKQSKKIPTESIYGARFSLFRAFKQFHAFEFLYYHLKGYRITCVELDGCRPNWTGEESDALLKLLKPIKVILRCDVPQQIEALFKSKTLKSVQLPLDCASVRTVAPRLLAAFQEVKIFVFAHSTDKFSLFRMVIQMLRSQPLPNLRIFRLAVCVPFFFQPKLEEQLNCANFMSKTELLRMPRGCYCRIAIEDHEYIDVEIYYGENLFL